jgi:plastocyanin
MPAKTMVTTTTAAAASPARSGHVTIAIRNYMYMPMHVVVRPGTKVTFHNDDMTAHTATSIKTGFDTGTIEPGKSATVTLKKVGTYQYHCLFHAFMMASITVAG